MMKQGAEIEPFSKFTEALDPWLNEVVLVGGWAHRLYRLSPHARKLAYLPLSTLDGDVAVPSRLKAERSSVRERLLAAGFVEEFLGEDRPPATHYHYGKRGGFYVEFLTALEGSEYNRGGKRKATKEVGGVSSQLLRYIQILMVSPWKVELGESTGYRFVPSKMIQIANPAAFLAQKILIHRERDHKNRAKDLLYIHDTIELFSEHLEELREIFERNIHPTLHPRRISELTGAADGLFGKVGDSIREAALMATGRNLGAEVLAETARAGLKEIFRVPAS
jgi:hypothetical protein